MKSKPRPAVVSDEEPTAPECPMPASLRVRLTNKAGGNAAPLESDVEAWLKIGWYRV
jgi:hypothetical protein